jgi:GntR family transcriptional regulator, colanic acid and biofilm gene transcriptional regulator
MPDLPPVSREMLHEQIFTVLKRNLMMGRFEPGQKLPLRGLAQSLGTSLMPVRDALQRLESMGCLVCTANRTMMVPIFTAKELLDICTLRVTLERTTAERAAVERTDQELEVLRSHLEIIRRSAKTNDIDPFLEANYHFHMAIAEMSRLAFIGHFLEPLWMHVGPTIRQSVPSDALLQSAAKNHQEVFDALAARHPQAAAAAIEKDILDGQLF